MTDSPVTRVLLAAVRSYRRLEHGREEVVRSYQNRRPGQDPRGYGYIPKADWEKGQQEWEKKGEAVYKANEWKGRPGAAKPAAKLGPTGASRPGAAKPDVDRPGTARPGVARLGPAGVSRPGGSGAASKAAARIKESAGGEAAPGTPAGASTVHGHKVRAVYTHPKSKAALYDLGNGLHAEGEPGGKPGPVQTSPTGLVPEDLAAKGWSRTVPKSAPMRPASERRPEGMVQALKSEQQSYRGHLERNPLFGTGTEGAAENAVYGAAAKSGIFNDTELSQLRNQVATLQEQLKGAASKAEVAKERAERAHERIQEVAEERAKEKHFRNDARAKLAVELMYIVGMLIFGAVSGGVGFVAALAMAAAAIPDAAKSLAIYHLAEKDTGIQRLLAHPVHHVWAGGKAVTERRGKEAAVKGLKKLKKELRASLPASGDVLALSRAGHARNQTAKVLRVAMVVHGMDLHVAKMVADHVADQAHQECLKRLAEHTLPGPKHG